MCGGSLDYMVELNEYCRANDIHFVAAESLGIFGYVFVDFGRNFIVSDRDGEPRQQFLITKIQKVHL